MSLRIGDRFRAFCLHVFLSSVAVGVFFVLVYLYWFPNGLVYAGAIKGLKILVLVDLILGPTLTFVVFDKNKRSLKFDLLAIAIIQILAFLYGAYVVYNERPVAQILADDGVATYTISELKEYEIDMEYSFIKNVEPIFLSLPKDRTKVVTSKITSPLMRGVPLALITEKHIWLEKIERDEFQERLDFIYGGASELERSQINMLNSKKTGELKCSWTLAKSKHADGFACLHTATGIQKFKLKTSVVSSLPDSNKALDNKQ